jgi:hypothetical protein
MTAPNESFSQGIFAANEAGSQYVKIVRGNTGRFDGVELVGGAAVDRIALSVAKCFAPFQAPLPFHA